MKANKFNYSFECSFENTFNVNDWPPSISKLSNKSRELKFSFIFPIVYVNYINL